MSRHGQCRCGVMLTFRRRDGYKTRCPGCGKIVRLRPDKPISTAAAPPPAAVETAEPNDYEEAFEHEPAEAMHVVMEDEEAPFVLAAEEAPAELVVEAPDRPPWTWQWLAVGGGLVMWVGLLSVLAWLWWQ
jgi:hypothetical protein